MRSGLFYNVPYFRLRLTAFYDPPAVHLHVSGRQEHCIIMSFPAPKCYFTGRGSFLKLHHFYNFLNFYSRHYYQQDFITYLECKQVWVMTLPRLRGIILADGSATISGVCPFCANTTVVAHADTRTCIWTQKAACTSALLCALIKCPGPDAPQRQSFSVPRVRVCMHVCVADKGGGGGGKRGGRERESFILNPHKSCRRKMSKCAG